MADAVKQDNNHHNTTVPRLGVPTHTGHAQPFVPCTVTCAASMYAILTKDLGAPKRRQLPGCSLTAGCLPVPCKQLPATGTAGVPACPCLPMELCSISAATEAAAAPSGLSAMHCCKKLQLPLLVQVLRGSWQDRGSRDSGWNTLPQFRSALPQPQWTEAAAPRLYPHHAAEPLLPASRCTTRSASHPPRAPAHSQPTHMIEGVLAAGATVYTRWHVLRHALGQLQLEGRQRPRRERLTVLNQLQLLAGSQAARLIPRSRSLTGGCQALPHAQAVAAALVWWGLQENVLGLLKLFVQHLQRGAFAPHLTVNP